MRWPRAISSPKWGHHFQTCQVYPVRFIPSCLFIYVDIGYSDTTNGGELEI